MGSSLCVELVDGLRGRDFRAVSAEGCRITFFADDGDPGPEAEAARANADFGNFGTTARFRLSFERFFLSAAAAASFSCWDALVLCSRRRMRW